MKTSNNAQKTENQKFEKPVSKTFAVVLSLVLISFTVTANGFWKHLLVNTTYGKMAILIVDQEKRNNELLTIADLSGIEQFTEGGAASNEFVFEAETDKNLELESWMTDASYFGSTIFTDQICEEEVLEIEDWMIDNPYFVVTVSPDEKEPVLELEAWMLDDKLWNN
jgi:hypothetical protein